MTRFLQVGGREKRRFPVAEPHQIHT